MPNGSMIQERDPLTVPSTRRNPVLADILNRLGYIDRESSGLEKIINGYEVQINYKENKKPTFRSDQYQFTVIMSNINYNVPQDVPRNVPQESLDEKTIRLIQNDNKISTKKCLLYWA